MAKRGKRRKEESPRWDEIRLLNRVTGEVLRQLLLRAPARGPRSLGTASWLAGGLAVSESTLSRMLSGSHSPAFEHIWFAAETLGLRPSQLVAVIEDAMRRIERLDVSAGELVSSIATGAMTDEQLNDLLRKELIAALDESEREAELWELVPEEGPDQVEARGGGSRWSRMLGSPATTSIVGTVLGLAAGVAAGRFFGGQDDEEVG